MFIIALNLKLDSALQHPADESLLSRKIWYWCHVL